MRHQGVQEGKVDSRLLDKGVARLAKSPFKTKIPGGLANLPLPATVERRDGLKGGENAPSHTLYKAGRCLEVSCSPSHHNSS